MKKSILGFILVMILGSAILLIWKNFSSSDIAFEIGTQHPSVRSAKLNQATLEKFLNEVNFNETKEYFGPGERLRVWKDDIKIIQIVFTNQPQGHLTTLGPNGEEVVSTGYKYDAARQTLEVSVFTDADLLQRTPDPTRMLNYYAMASLYYLRYLDYEEFITSNKFDFYGTVLNEVSEFQKSNQPIATYEII